MTQKGFVYIMTNPSMPGLLKVGMTTKVPEYRANQLSTTTGVPTPFETQYYAFFENRVEAEKRAHQALNDYHHGKEFYQVDINTAINVIESINISFTRLFVEGQQGVQKYHYNERLEVEKSLSLRINFLGKKIKKLGAEKWTTIATIREQEKLKREEIELASELETLRKEAELERIKKGEELREKAIEEHQEREAERIVVTAEWRRIEEEWGKINKEKEKIKAEITEWESLRNEEDFEINEEWKRIEKESEAFVVDKLHAEWELEQSENIIKEAEIEINAGWGLLRDAEDLGIENKWNEVDEEWDKVINEWEALLRKKKQEKEKNAIFEKKGNKIVKKIVVAWEYLKKEKEKFKTEKDDYKCQLQSKQ
ncbi:GIY-YIG nuclease family protein [Desulfobacterales bacterium HSG17]|nr:GIY-YIG nuclease family protein [Desulfobacterales bacterium HSG17]